ncbi:MAG: hypothetical protein PUK59_05740 [Actinomycetaceae bacterium]|nr:hypothetical protein [Actinomycetaceae bacterium]MDY5854725.1 hypothetical protein [Arcanobacterium sp.]
MGMWRLYAVVAGVLTDAPAGVLTSMVSGIQIGMVSGMVSGKRRLGCQAEE